MVNCVSLRKCHPDTAGVAAKDAASVQGNLASSLARAEAMPSDICGITGFEKTIRESREQFDNHKSVI